MPTNDLYQDQLMVDHDSRLWGQSLIFRLTKDLLQSGWTKRPGKYYDLTVYDKADTRSVSVNLMHNRPGLDSTHAVVSDVVTPQYPGPVIPLYPEVFGFYHHDMVYKNHLPHKKYNCFINRGCPFRQSWFYQLVRNDMLDNGHVSYWCHDRYSTKSAAEYFEELYQSGNQIFEVEHNKIKHNIPFKNFDISIEDAIIDSERSLVIETFFADPKFITYSEKIWRVLQLPRPWILFGTVNAIKYLRSWGFDVFDDVIDHSYDKIDNEVQRQLACLEQLKKPLIYNEQILIDFEQRAEHNRTLLKKYKSQWEQRYQATLKSINDQEKYCCFTSAH